MGPVQMAARTFSTHINNGKGTFFGKHTYGANTFFIHFYAIFFTPDAICVDNKDKPIAGCKNQLFKVFEKFLAPKIHHIEIMTYI